MIKVNDLYLTIQGEGAHTGTPMVLVRLQGCAVGCPWCDSKPTWLHQAGKMATLEEAKASPAAWCEIEESELAEAVRRYWLPRGWVLITGGEPTEQNLWPLLAELRLRLPGCRIAIETSGTGNGLWEARTLPDWMCLSPKFDMPGKRNIEPFMVAWAHEIKMPIGKEEDVERFEAFLGVYKSVMRPGVVLSIQPLYGSRKAEALCVETCLRKGWRLSLQAHKSIGLP